MWLPLLVIFVLCVSITNPVLWAETQLQEIELVSEGETDSSDDDKSITGFIPGLTTYDFPSPCRIYSGKQPPVFGSDAYPSSILHGPPAQGFPV